MENTPAVNNFETTLLLKAWSEGDEMALERLVPLVDAEMRRLARHYLRQERPGHILQTTALVNEAWLRLINWPGASWQNRAHFIGMAARLMRRVLVGEARRRKAPKYGGDALHISLANAEGIANGKSADLVALDDALNELAKFDELQAKIVELRFFGGLSLEEIAEVLKISTRTVQREWSLAQAWLYRSLNGDMDPNRWKKIKEVYHRALDLRGDERENFLAKACGGNDDLCCEVKSMLAAPEWNPIGS